MGIPCLCFSLSLYKTKIHSAFCMIWVFFLKQAYKSMINHRWKSKLDDRCHKQKHARSVVLCRPYSHLFVLHCGWSNRRYKCCLPLVWQLSIYFPYTIPIIVLFILFAVFIQTVSFAVQSAFSSLDGWILSPFFQLLEFSRSPILKPERQVKIIYFLQPFLGYSRHTKPP